MTPLFLLYFSPFRQAYGIFPSILRREGEGGGASNADLSDILACKGFVGFHLATIY
jgi:hypothetical protein